MKNIYIPTSSPEDWRKLLADPENHWKDGYSAKMLAYSWQNSINMPNEIKSLLNESDFSNLQNMEILFAFPEHKVFMPPSSGHPSQNDLFVLGKAQDGNLISIMIEGKASETFGPTIEDWMKDISIGKQERINFIKDKLMIKNDIPINLRYQLFHRIVSAIVEAEKFSAKYAIMIIHSFSPTNQWFNEYQDFIRFLGKESILDRLIYLFKNNNIEIYSGWAHGV